MGIFFIRNWGSVEIFVLFVGMMKKSYKNVIERGRKDAKDVIGDIFVARIFVLDV